MIIKDKKIKVPLFDQFKIRIIFADNLKEEIDNITNTKSEINYKGIFCFKNNGLNLILGFEGDNPSPGLISHECFHAVAYILDYVGIKFSEDSEETYTYLLSYLVDKIYSMKNILK